MSKTTKLWIGIAILIVLSPLGLIVPARFRAGSAWGEWGTDEMGRLAGYIPQGLARLSTLWHAPIPDYAFNGWEEKELPHLSLAYIISAVVGIALVASAVWLIGKALSRKGN